MVHCAAPRGVLPGKGDRIIAPHQFQHDRAAPPARRPRILADVAGTLVPVTGRAARALAAAASLAAAAAAPTLAQDGNVPAPQPPAESPEAQAEAEAEAAPQPAPTPAPAPEPAEFDEPLGPGMFEFNFTDGVDLTVLVDYVADAFGLQIVLADGSLMGEKVFLPSPITIPADQVMRFLNRLLEQKGFTITRDIGGVYIIQRAEQVQPGLGEDPFSVTRIIPTPGVRPSSLSTALGVIGVGGGQAAPGRPAAGGAAIAYLDDLGVILITASPRQTQDVQMLVNRLIAEQASIGFQRIELRFVAASYARERILGLIGSIPQNQPVARANVPGQANVPAQAPGFGGTTLLNVEDRLTVDSQTNSLIFRGRPEETSELTRLLAVVDVPNTLVSRWYAVGSAAAAVASEGQRRALGGVVTEQGAFPGGISQGVRFQVPGFQQQAAQLVGTGFVVFPEAGGFVYRGTDAQHRDVEQLIDNLSELTSAEHVVVEFYKLHHSDAEDVAEIIQNLLTNQLPTGGSPLLGRDTRTQLAQRTPPPPPPEEPAAEGEAPAEGAVAGAAPDDIGAITASEDTHVLADAANNQVVVKAPKRLQDQFARLIDRLDLRRPQVYIDAKIVAVTATDEFRLAFETQLTAGDFSLNTNFGLGTFGEGSGITGEKTVPPLANFTAALIRSEYVPLIITALQNNTDTRILSTPQLLVDDNESATVASIERQPFAQTVQTAGSPTVTSQGGESEAGTTLLVTPQISEGGYLRLDYEIELSSFLGSAASPGLAPPSQVNNISADSVTVPSDTTIVVGGLTFESESRTVLKVPLLGDIPIVGHLFRDQGKSNRKTTLYVFITPTIMREPNFADLRLLTKGPAAVAGIEPMLPERGPVRIDILPSSRARAAVAPAPTAPPSLPSPPPATGPGPEPEPAFEADDGWVAPTSPSQGRAPDTADRRTRRPS